MQTITGLDIPSAYNEFSLARTYQDRLAAFASYFNLFSFSFSHFDEQISFLRLDPAIERLHEIYKQESQQSIVLRKVFTIDKNKYVFDVTPINSLPPVFNGYIVNKFIDEDLQFRALIHRIETQQQYTGEAAKKLLDQSDTILKELQQCLRIKGKKYFRAQLVNVFFSGYHDAADNIVRTFRYRKKILELYLYAQGIMYHRYRQKLRQYSLFPFPAAETSIQNMAIEWTAQIQLLHNMGILDLLKKRIDETPGSTSFHGYMKIVCHIIGQSPLMAGTVGEYLAQLEDRSPQ